MAGDDFTKKVGFEIHKNKVEMKVPQFKNAPMNYKNYSKEVMVYIEKAHMMNPLLEGIDSRKFMAYNAGNWVTHPFKIYSGSTPFTRLAVSDAADQVVSTKNCVFTLFEIFATIGCNKKYEETGKILVNFVKLNHEKLTGKFYRPGSCFNTNEAGLESKAERNRDCVNQMKQSAYMDALLKNLKISQNLDFLGQIKNDILKKPLASGFKHSGFVARKPLESSKSMLQVNQKNVKKNNLLNDKNNQSYCFSNSFNPGLVLKKPPFKTDRSNDVELTLNGTIEDYMTQDTEKDRLQKENKRNIKKKLDNCVNRLHSTKTIILDKENNGKFLSNSRYDEWSEFSTDRNAASFIRNNKSLTRPGTANPDFKNIGTRNNGSNHKDNY